MPLSKRQVREYSESLSKGYSCEAEVGEFVVYRRYGNYFVGLVVSEDEGFITSIRRHDGEIEEIKPFVKRWVSRSSRLTVTPAELLEKLGDLRTDNMEEIRAAVRVFRKVSANKADE